MQAHLNRKARCRFSAANDLANLAGYIFSYCKTRIAARAWHTWPMLRIGLVGKSGKCRVTGVQRPVVCLEGLTCLSALVGFMQLPLEQPPQKGLSEPPSLPRSPEMPVLHLETSHTSP